VVRVAPRSVCGGIGGSSVAKILVADDNSNIQKMVVLALKDQGIEVVAVGNGEAAVRKISDLKPDLVLADIFMPVRNGYEVCKFVKDDSALSHIPVILLVGAFDPLDEQEASRVGADGVLKKPFVPPDPLISMVKAALARAGVAVGATASTSTPPPPMPSATKTPPPPVAALPKIAPPAPVLVQDREEDLGTPVFSVPRPAPLTIATGAQPLAFGSLLETAAPEDDAVFTVSSSTHSAPDRNWGNSASAEEEEEPEETSKTGSWRISSAIDEAVSETPAGQTDWREAAFSGIGSGAGSETAQASGWAPSTEKNSLAITEEEAAELAQKRDALSAVGSSPVPEDWRKRIEEVLPSIPQPATEEPLQKAIESPLDEPFFAPPPPPPPAIPEAAVADVELPEIPAAEVAAPEVAPSAQPEASRNVNSWMAGAVSPWEAELERASQLTSTWDTAKIAADLPVEQNSATEPFLDTGVTSSAYESPAESTVESAVQPTVVEAPPAEESLLSPAASEDIPAIESLLTTETKEFLQEETAHVVAQEMPLDLEQASQHEASGYAAHVISEPAAVPSPAPNMDEIVAKVLAKMNPEVLQAVTREILKPLVEAMIKDELNKK
jgi:CheY-like chemotaxis protein